MKRYLLSMFLSAACAYAVSAQTYSWDNVPMDASRTGCTSPSVDDIDKTVGTFKGRKYISPSGKEFSGRTATAKTAAIVAQAQPAMAKVKKVIGYSTSFMEKDKPESALSNWFIDLLMAKTEKLSGKTVHIGITNFGGIRIDMPQGEIILDDMLSMFPFDNQLVYIEHTGKQIRTILERMAAGSFQVLGGVRVVAKNGRLVSAEIDGKPIDDDKVYGLATISFLLGGGDGLSLEDNALSVTVYEDVKIIDAVLEHVYAETAAGRPIEYQTDGRVKILGGEE